MAVFHSHTYSRTAALFDRYAEVLALADRMIVAPIYAAREVDTCGMSARVLAEAVGERAIAAESLEDIVEILQREVRPSDTVVIMGAGDIDKIWERLPLGG